MKVGITSSTVVRHFPRFRPPLFPVPGREGSELGFFLLMRKASAHHYWILVKTQGLVLPCPACQKARWRFIFPLKGHCAHSGSLLGTPGPRFLVVIVIIMHKQ